MSPWSDGCFTSCVHIDIKLKVLMLLQPVRLTAGRFHFGPFRCTLEDKPLLLAVEVPMNYYRSDALKFNILQLMLRFYSTHSNKVPEMSHLTNIVYCTARLNCKHWACCCRWIARSMSLTDSQQVQTCTTSQQSRVPRPILV